MYNPFTKHPKEVDETYFEHMKKAIKYGLRIQLISLMIFVHGSGLSHMVWVLQTRYFAFHGYNALAIDLPGHGLSSGESLKSIEEMADWVNDVIDAVGHKKASVVMSQWFGFPAFPVDTHIHRLASRWGLSKAKNVEMTERDLKLLWPKETWNKRHLQMEHLHIRRLVTHSSTTSWNH